MPASVNLIEKIAFNACFNLERVEIIGNSLVIEMHAFMDCFSLTEVILSENVAEIGEEAFLNCANLEYLNIPASVEFIGMDPLVNEFKFKGYNVHEDNRYYSSDGNGVLFNKNKTELIAYPVAREAASYTVPDTVKTINKGAFEFAYNLEEIVFTEQLNTIEAYAFYLCVALREVTIPENIDSIGEHAFGMCFSLENAYIYNPDVNIAEMGICMNYGVLLCSADEFIERHIYVAD